MRSKVVVLSHLRYYGHSCNMHLVCSADTREYNYNFLFRFFLAKQL